MIPKRIVPFAWGDGRPAATLLNVGRRGFDRGQLTKLAAAEAFIFAPDIKSENGYAFVHVITTGAMEKYASNNNADGFNETAGPYTGDNGKIIQLAGGLKQYHSTFTKYGAVYLNHFNSKKGGTPSGTIAAETYNPEMCRGELILKLPLSKWAADIEALDRGEPFFVSMGCYLAGALVKMADGSFKPIEEVLPGEQVVTHRGSVAAVESTREMVEETEVYRIHPSCCFPLVCTGNHEHFVLRREQLLVKGYFRDAINVEREAAWVRTDELRPRDWLVMPRPELGPAVIDSKFARVAGWYLAEGMLHKDLRENSWRTRFCCGDADVFLDSLMSYLQELQPANPPRRSSYSEHGVVIEVTDESLHNRLLPFGKGAKNKRLPAEVFTWNCQAVLDLLGAYLEGDGCFYTQPRHVNSGNLYASTSSKQLALQIQQLGLALGGFVSLQEVAHHTSFSATTADGFCICYQMRFDAELTRLLAPYCRIVERVPEPSNNGKQRIIGKYAITSISTMDCVEMQTEVYNLHVASADHSYLVNGVGTHNCGVPYDICSVCLNQAPDRASYCEHLKYAANTLRPSGRLVMAINDQPHFHDISKVGKPADRIAFALRKVAAEGAGLLEPEVAAPLWVPLSVINAVSSRKEASRIGLLDKLAELEKRIQAQGLAPAEKDLADAFGKECEPDQITRLMKIPLGELMASTQRANVMLPPKTLIMVVTRRPAADIPGLAELPAAIRSVFGGLRERGDLFHELTDDGSYAPGLCCPAQSTTELVNGMKRDFSLDDEPVRQRVIRITIHGGRPTNSDKTANDSASAEAQVLAREYAKYQLSYLAGRPHTEAELLVTAIHNQSY